MFFKNLVLYRLPSGWALDPDILEAALSARPLLPCGGLDRETWGWLPPRDDERHVHVSNQQILIALGMEQKLLPASVVNQVVADRVEEIEARQGYRPGRKQLRELKEQVFDELLPRAFSRRRRMHAWIDPVHGWLVVDTSARARAETLLEQLNKTLEDLPARIPHTERSPGAAMGEWLLAGEAPAGFSIDHDLELRAPDEGNATVRYVRHALEGEEIRAHIATGKSVTRLGMTWNDRISFVLDDKLQIKRLVFLDIIEQQAGEAENADERFELDFTLMTGELARMLDDLIAALGGEKAGAI
jgi:recombination associated protein RdgC